MSRYQSDKHFAYRLGLCPGGNVMRGKTKCGANRAEQALRRAAAALRASPSVPGAYFRRLSDRMDKPKAVTWAANKLALLIYSLSTRGGEHTDQAQAYYEQHYQHRVLTSLNEHAYQWGMKLAPTAPAAHAGSKILCALATYGQLPKRRYSLVRCLRIL